MTALRPERDSDAPYERQAYGDAGAFEAAVDNLHDPLSDPLQEQPYEYAQPLEYEYGPEQSYEQAATYSTYEQSALYEQVEAYEQPQDDETVGLRTADTRRAADGTGGTDEPSPEGLGDPGGRAARRRAAKEAARGAALGAVLGGVLDGVLGGGGKRGGRRRAGAATGTRASSTRASSTNASAQDDSAKSASKAPLSRLEARRAERAKRPSPAVIASRAVGEVFISVGVLMLLFVTYQLWWTNIRAGQQAGSETNKIQEGWASGARKPGAFEPGQGFAIMHIPRLDVVVPVAEGIDKEKVLDRGMVGHYAKEPLKTGMPGDKQGNFAVAGHRNTHGEPFRYINRLEKGDPIVVETQDKYYVYSMRSILPQTSPSNTGVIDPVPKGAGFTGPGRYITLTTCTPEFTSTYRLIVWGKMVEERPRSKGKPDALVR